MHIQKHIRLLGRVTGRVLTVLAMVLLLAGCFPSPQSELARLRALSDTHFRNTVTVQDDALDLVAVFTTANGFQFNVKPHDGIISADEFLRAIVNKQNGGRTFQLYLTINYPFDGWRLYNAASYETPNGPRQAQVLLVNRSKDCARISGGGRQCFYTEEAVFAIDESLVRALADRYGSGDPIEQSWHYKFTARSGDQFSGFVVPAEAKGLLERMQAHRLEK